MTKFVTRDNKSIKIKVEPESDELKNLLINIVPRLSYDEILDGELEKRLKDTSANIKSVELSACDDIKQILLCKAVFDAISKPIGS